MSKQYDNTNRGVLFANKARKTDSQPNARGTLNVDGTEYWISAWTKTSQNGERYQSLSIQPKEERQPIASEPDAEPFNDEIPF